LEEPTGGAEKETGTVSEKEATWGEKVKDRVALSEADLLSDIDSLLFGDDLGGLAAAPAKAPQGGDFDEDELLSDIAGLIDKKGDEDSSVILGFKPDDGAEETVNDTDHPSVWPEKPDEETELGQLRKLIMDRELTQLSYLSNVITDPGNHAQALSQVITEAILLRSRKDDKLNTVLGPTVEKIFSASVRRNPETLANNIFPVIGPAIRRSISETFTSMLQNFNSTLEMSLSLKGLKWRLEALRVRKPFSEIVLLHTLLYHVEEIYLIHASSGLVLDHLVYEGGETRDSDLVAGMFTAIQDFVKDSFSTAQGESLDNLRFGERIIFLKRADPIYMACVVRGNPPASLSQDLQEALELVVVESAEDLENFDGNTEPFKKFRHYFADFLTVRYQDKPKKLPFLIRYLPFIGILLILFAFFSSYWSKNDQLRHDEFLQTVQLNLERAQQKTAEAANRHFERGLDLLRQEPGLVVTRVSRLENGKMDVVVLRDILSRDPREILIEEGDIDPDIFEITSRPYVSLDQDIVDQRIKETIELLPTVTMDFDGRTGVMKLTGTAPMGWILATRERAADIAGVNEVDTSALIDPRTKEMETLVGSINGVVVHFPINSDVPIPEDMPALVQAVDNLVTLEKLATEMQMHVNLVIYGHADATGQDRRNYELSEQRTKTVAAMLYAKGSSIPISNYGLGSQFSSKSETGPPVQDQDSRKIELHVRVTQSMF
jgi:OOP family OmpA-OmpF porin